MIKKTIFFFFLLVVDFLFSQKLSNSNYIFITGKVIEAKTNQPLEYATIILKDTITKKITGGITDDRGSFRVQTPKGIYNISIEFISFKTKKIRTQNISSNRNLGIIKLDEDTNSLEEVFFITEKSTVDIRLDKKIYNVGKDMTLKGATASDVLDNIPSVNVDAEGTVSLRGSGNVRILIDGKPSALVGLSGTDALRQLPSDAIERVEVITNPSARYDSEGTSGILNIILRKGKEFGFNGSANATVGNPKNYRGTVNLNLRSKKINLFSNFGYSDRGGPGIYNSDITYLTNGIIDSTRTENRGNNRNRKGFNANIGLEYFLNKKSSITGTLFLRDSEGNDISTNTISSFDVFQNNLYNSTRIQNENEIDKTFQFSMNYQNRFDEKGHLLTFDFQHSSSKEEESAIITDINPETNSTNELSINNLFQVDYVLPIGKKTQFEAGYRGNFQDLKSDYLVIAPNLDPRFNPSNNLNFSQNVNAFYSQFGSKINKFSYLFGLRSEITAINISLLNNQESYQKRYTDLFPTVNFGFELSEKQNFILGYSRRLRRPRSRSLNPFENRASEIIFYTGNINLNPTYTNSFDLSYLNRWGKLTFNSSIYYQHSTNNIVRVNRQEIRVIGGKETNVLLRKPINLSSEDRAGFELTANYNATKKIKFSGSFNFFQFETKGDYSYSITDPNTNEISVTTQNFDAKNSSWFTRFDAKITLPGNIQSQTRVSYTGPRNNAQSDVEGLFYVNLAFSKDLLKEKATLVLNLSDIFNSRKYKFKNFAPNRETPSNITDQTYQRRVRQISLNFSYRFNQNKNQRKDNSKPVEDSGSGNNF